LSDNPDKPVREYPEFNRHVYGIAAAPDGSSFLIGGLGGDASAPSVVVNSYDDTGNLTAPLPQLRYGEEPCFIYDPSGTVVFYYTQGDAPSRSWTLAMPSL